MSTKNSCNCRSDIEARMLALFAEKNPQATDHRVNLTGYAFLISDLDIDMKGCMPMELSAKFPLRNGGFKEKTQKQNMMFNYCPFCGEKYPVKEGEKNDAK